MTKTCAVAVVLAFMALALPAGAADSNQAPVASFEAPDWAHNGAPVRLEDRSQDNDGSVVAWAWTFGDVGQSNEPNPVMELPAGVHEVCLQVTDDLGATDVTCRDVSVEALLLQGRAAPMSVWTRRAGGYAPGDTGLVASEDEAQRGVAGGRYNRDGFSTRTARGYVEIAEFRVTSESHLNDVKIELPGLGTLHAIEVEAMAYASCAGSDGTARARKIMLDETPLFVGADGAFAPDNTEINLGSGYKIKLNEHRGGADPYRHETIVMRVTLPGSEILVGYAHAQVSNCAEGVGATDFDLLAGVDALGESGAVAHAATSSGVAPRGLTIAF